jgi:hypothetical protein
MVAATVAGATVGIGQTNWLEALTPKQIRQMALGTTNAIYAGSFRQLNREERRLRAINRTRVRDNKYFLNWLNNKSQAMNAQQDANQAALIDAQSQVQQDLADQWGSLREGMVESGEETPGVISNAGDATAYDTSAEAMQSLAQAAAQRTATVNAMQVGDKMQNIAGASNFAAMAAARARQQADMWEKMGEMGDARQQLRMDRAAAAAKEVARLLDREIEKTQIRSANRAERQKLILEAARIKLDEKDLALARDQFQYDRYNDNRNFNLDRQDVLSQIADRARDNEREDNEANGNGGNGRDQEDREEAREEQRDIQRGINRVLREGIALTQANPDLRRYGKRNPSKYLQIMGKKLSSQIAARAVYDLVFLGGSFSAQSRRALRDLGYRIPDRWK